MGTKKIEKCEVCKYCSVDENIHFVCRRYAPKMVCGSGMGWSDQKWPIVDPGDWCGEFKPENA